MSTDAPSPGRLPGGLKPHQRQVFDFLMTHPCGGLARCRQRQDTHGAAGAVDVASPEGRVRIVAPLAIPRSVWADKIRKWGLGVRTRSMVVNDRDRTLTRAQRPPRCPPACPPVSAGLPG